LRRGVSRKLSSKTALLAHICHVELGVAVWAKAPRIDIVKYSKVLLQSGNTSEYGIDQNEFCFTHKFSGDGTCEIKPFRQSEPA
jgi:hypothetical protein